MICGVSTAHYWNIMKTDLIEAGHNNMKYHHMLFPKQDIALL